MFDVNVKGPFSLATSPVLLRPLQCVEISGQDRDLRSACFQIGLRPMRVCTAETKGDVVS